MMEMLGDYSGKLRKDEKNSRISADSRRSERAKEWQRFLEMSENGKELLNSHGYDAVQISSGNISTWEGCKILRKGERLQQNPKRGTNLQKPDMTT
ncbi:hypothetical protein Taro_009094 [Colocasia esculenta]|uniref:Uncharacterized protein n=1 Tax=Colocasia esculenta TaxID=4460 RepID=A0A843TZ57_COLES|nr:hypothetical protein [Colocasia esculenta]